MTAQLVLKDFSGVPEVTSSALELKRKALAVAAPISRVETPEQQGSAIDALRLLKELRTGMEATRKSVKSPVLELGRKIDALAHGFLEEVDRQFFRLSGLINYYQKKQNEIKQGAEGVIQEKETEAKRLREEAERKRMAGDTIGAEKLEAQAFDLEMQTEVAVAPVLDRPKGLVVRNRLNFQVFDPIVFVQAYPQFWKWRGEDEVLKLDRMLVLDELNNEKGLFRRTRFPEELSVTEGKPELVQPPGVRVFEETKSHLR